MSRSIAGVLAVTLAAAGCGDDGLSYEGTPGARTATDYSNLVPMVAATVNEAPATFLVDTGAFLTIVDDRFGFADGLHDVDLSLLGLTFPGYQVATWNLFPDADSAGGIVGGDLLRHFALTLDYRDDQAWLDAPFDPAASNDPGLGGRVDVPVEIAGGGYSLIPSGETVDVPPTRIVTRMFLEGDVEPVWVIVDSGASFLLIDEDVLALLGDAAGRPRMDGIDVSTIDGVVQAYLSRVWDATLVAVDGGQPAASVTDLPVLVIPGTTFFDSASAELGVPVRVIVGGSYLRRFRTTIDYPERLLRLSRYTDAPHVDPREFVGLGVSLSSAGGTWSVSDVIPGSDAEALGLLVGDVVVTVAAMPIGGQPGDVVDGIIAAFAIGERVPLGILRAGASQELQVLVEDFLPSYPPPP